jgi:hypothetical protein
VTAAAPTRPARLPIPFYLLLLPVLVVGGAAGRIVEPMLQWTSPLVAVLLFLGARSHQRRLSHTVFPDRLAQEIAKTLVQLPDGNAKDSFNRLLLAAEPVYKALARAPLGGARQQDVAQLVDYACRAAVDLSDLELTESNRGARLRDALSQRFAKGIEVLHRLRVELVHADPRQAECQALLERLDEEAQAWRAARIEVSRLLAR